MKLFLHTLKWEFRRVAWLVGLMWLVTGCVYWVMARYWQLMLFPWQTYRSRNLNSAAEVGSMEQWAILMFLGLFLGILTVSSCILKPGNQGQATSFFVTRPIFFYWELLSRGVVLSIAFLVPGLLGYGILLFSVEMTHGVVAQLLGLCLLLMTAISFFGLGALQFRRTIYFVPFAFLFCFIWLGLVLESGHSSANQAGGSLYTFSPTWMVQLGVTFGVSIVGWLIHAMVGKRRYGVLLLVILFVFNTVMLLDEEETLRWENMPTDEATLASFHLENKGGGFRITSDFERESGRIVNSTVNLEKRVSTRWERQDVGSFLWFKQPRLSFQSDEIALQFGNALQIQAIDFRMEDELKRIAYSTLPLELNVEMNALDGFWNRYLDFQSEVELYVYEYEDLGYVNPDETNILKDGSSVLKVRPFLTVSVPQKVDTNRAISMSLEVEIFEWSAGLLLSDEAMDSNLRYCFVLELGEESRQRTTLYNHNHVANRVMFFHKSLALFVLFASDDLSAEVKKRINRDNSILQESFTFSSLNARLRVFKRVPVSRTTVPLQFKSYLRQSELGIRTHFAASTSPEK